MWVLITVLLAVVDSQTGVMSKEPEVTLEAFRNLQTCEVARAVYAKESPQAFMACVLVRKVQ